MSDLVASPKQRPAYYRRLRILFLYNAFNSMSQRAFLECTGLGHNVQKMEYNCETEVLKIMQDAEESAEGHFDVVLCPFLTKMLPEKVYNHDHIPCWIIHPGIEGDRGMSSIDWALLRGQKEWGVTLLQADEVADGGDIWATENFSLDRTKCKGAAVTKSSVYRREVIDSAMICLHKALDMFLKGEKPRKLDYNRPGVKGTLNPTMKQTDRVIDWTQDATTVWKRCNASDSQPGVAETFFCSKYLLYGFHVEPESQLTNGQREAAPKTLLGHRHGAILVRCGKGALWVTHMKRPNVEMKRYFKRTAYDVLDEHVVKDLPMLPLPRGSLHLQFGTYPSTFQEIYVWQRNRVTYVWFDFYNGAMSTGQCERLVATLRQLKEQRQTDGSKVLVLLGGHNFFSNGVHLNEIEGKDDPALESWLNINAIDDVVQYVLEDCGDCVTVSALTGNAGAGGVMAALAADHVWTHGSVVLNSSYKPMALYGSEYWTYSLPRRVGQQKAMELTDSTDPISAKTALEINLIDRIMPGNALDFVENVVTAAEQLAKDSKLEARLQAKKTKVEDSRYREVIAKHREMELEQMKKSFVSPAYVEKRKQFVYKHRALPCVKESLAIPMPLDVCQPSKAFSKAEQVRVPFSPTDPKWLLASRTAGATALSA